jgi:flagellar motor switch protein FliM
VENNSKFLYHRHLKLGPAIGDWTTLQYRDPALDDVHISQIQNVNFDSLPRKYVERLHYLHYRFAGDLVKQFSRDMDIKVELHSIAALQMTYGEFLSQQKEHKVVQSDYILGDLGRINVIYNWDLADVIVNRLTGGEGEESELDVFTDTEAIILESQTQSLLPLFIKSWGSFLDPALFKQAFHVGTFQYDQKVSLREAYLGFTFYLYFGKGELKTITWAYPSSLIRHLVSEMEAHLGPVPENVSLSRETKKQVDVDVLATIGKSKLTMHELKHLQVGDIVSLDMSYDTPVEILLGDSIRLKGQPGIIDNKVCVQLLSSDADKTMSLISEELSVSSKTEVETNVESSGPDVNADIGVDVIDPGAVSEEGVMGLAEEVSADEMDDELEDFDSDDELESSQVEATKGDEDVSGDLDDDFGDFSWDDDLAEEQDS